MKSDTILFNRTVKHSLSISSTTLGENKQYFMFKYGIYMSEWENSKAYIKRNIHYQ